MAVKPRSLASNFSASPQFSRDDLREAYSQGCRSIIVNRPDDEEASQLSIDSMRDAAIDAGLAFAAFPIRPGQISDRDVEQFSQALQKLAGPTIGYCRTGSRVATLWARANTSLLGAQR
jgi:sulfide:quinone oxidoreductase